MRAGAPAPAGAASTRRRANLIRRLSASPDVTWIAAIVAATEGPELWRLSADGRCAGRLPNRARPSWPAWMPSGEVACIVNANGHPPIAASCGADPMTPAPDIDAIGPIGSDRMVGVVHFASPNDLGMVDLRQMELASRAASKLTAFSRDSYAPSVSRDGTVLFRTQACRTFVDERRDGQTRQRTSFQAETPWWHLRDPARLAHRRITMLGRGSDVECPR